MQLASSESADTSLGPFQAKVHLTSVGGEVLHTIGIGKVISISASAMPCLLHLLGLCNVCMHALKWLSARWNLVAFCSSQGARMIWSEVHPVIACALHVESVLMLSLVMNTVMNRCNTMEVHVSYANPLYKQCGNETRNWACMQFWRPRLKESVWQKISVSVLSKGLAPRLQKGINI